MNHNEIEPTMMNEENALTAGLQTGVQVENATRLPTTSEQEEPDPKRDDESSEQSVASATQLGSDRRTVTESSVRDALFRGLLATREGRVALRAEFQASQPALISMLAPRVMSITNLRAAELTAYTVIAVWVALREHGLAKTVSGVHIERVTRVCSGMEMPPDPFPLLMTIVLQFLAVACQGCEIDRSALLGEPIRIVADATIALTLAAADDDATPNSP
jgi:hypothetical protein